MRILVACEESQTVTKAFRAIGHEAYSCDILPCSGGHPEWHRQEDVIEVLAVFPYQKSGAMKKVYEYTNTGNSLGAPAGATKQIHEANEGSAARFFYCGKASRADRNEGCDDLPDVKGGMISNTSGQHLTRRDENYNPDPVKNNWPTVKPTNLMRYYVRLITPPNAKVVEPFLGSGSTGKACAYEFVDEFVGIDREVDAMAIAKARIDYAIRNRDGQINIF